MAAGIYIHFPFCKRKCHYCDFYSVTQLALSDSYVSSLISEIRLRQNWLNIAGLLANDMVDSVFIGGGTPSLLSPKMLGDIFNELHKNFTITEDAEITLECNPGASDAKYFADYHSIGINRLSIGVQSFVDTELKFLQRIHSGTEAVATIEAAKSIFNNVSIDLLFAVPGQSVDSLLYSLSKAVASELQHISCYSLVFEENTPLFDDLLSNKVKEMGDAQSADMYETMCGYLADNSFLQYEISNFALEGYHSRHNQKYWTSQDVIAFGPSAVGLASGVRYKNYSDLKEYITLLGQNELPNEYTENLDRKLQLTEHIFLSLRSSGLNLEQLNSKFGINLLAIAPVEISQILNAAYASISNGTLKLSPKGYYICDEITLKILKIIEDFADV